MSLLANIDHISITAGIESVIVQTARPVRSCFRHHRGEGVWHPILAAALDLFNRTEEMSIRIIVGRHTIVVQREGDEVVCIVLPTGHVIAKSLRRMIRRMARKDRAPLASSRPSARPQVPEPSSPEPSSPEPSCSPGPSERCLERSARVVCGDGAEEFGDSTSGQWDHLARWAGFESWEQVELAARGRAFEDVPTPQSTPEQRAVAAVLRRQRWESNSPATL